MMIYLDNAATTKMAPETVEKMLPFFTEDYGNPSAIYAKGSKAKKAVNESRRSIADSLCCKMEEIFFTSGGTESDNWAIRMACAQNACKGKHIITTKIEHPAVLKTCEDLGKQGYRITYLDVDEKGFVTPAQVENAIGPDTILVSVMFANNEIGTIEPIAQIGEVTRKKGVLFHTDAVQAYGQLPIAVEEYKIDLLSASGHKFHGPKGVGFLYVRSSTRLEALLTGGGQEMGKRSGTENVAGIVGMAAAAKYQHNTMEEQIKKTRQLRDYLVRRMTGEIPNCFLTGADILENRLPGNASFVLPGLEGESLLVLLDMRGICASSGSACSSGTTKPSHVLTAIGQGGEAAKGSLRLTLSAENTMAEIDETVEAVKDIAGRLRGLTAH